MADFSACRVSFDKASYNVGDPIRVNLTGQAVTTTTTPVALTGSVHAQAADGSAAVLNIEPPAQINMVTQTPVATNIASVSDGTSRVYAVDPSGQFATATA